MEKLYFEENEKKKSIFWGDTMEKAPMGCWRPFGQHRMGIEDPLGKAQRELGDLVGNAYSKEETFWEKPRLKHRPVGPISSHSLPMFSFGKIRKKASSQFSRKQGELSGPVAYHVCKYKSIK
jgi:hypothetical protein